MRFAETLGIHITPEWKSVFINYEVVMSNLSKLVEKSFPQNDTNFPDHAAHVRVFPSLTEMKIAAWRDSVNNFFYNV